MNEIVTEHSEGVLRVELNRPAKRNAMTASMYVTLADVFIDAARTSARASRSGTAQETRSAPATISRIF